MRQASIRRALLAALILATLATTAARAQVESGVAEQEMQAAQNPNTPTIRVYSRETIVDVLVKDDNSQPVRGLKRSDFTIEEDSHPQPIRGFYEYDRSSPAPAAALPANTYSNARTLPASGPVQILYFDIPCSAALPPGSDAAAGVAQGGVFVRAKKYIADYLRTMPAGTQVTVFAYRCDYGLRLLQGFTTDGQRAATAIDNLVVVSAGKPPSADPIAAAHQMAAYVAGIRGRKNLIWIGNPLQITRDGGLSWGAQDMTRVHRLMDLYDRFTEAQIAVYPFDPAGVPAPGSAALGWNSLRAEEIADATGGAAIYNTNDYKSAVAKVVDDTSDYYTLSYIPPRANDDGHYHPIKITVDRPGLHLSYRGGYNSEQPAPPDAILQVRMTQATMGLGALPATQLLFDATVEPSPPSDPAHPQAFIRKPLTLAGKQLTTYDTLFTLQPTQIAFTQGADRMYGGALEFDLAAYDSFGNLITTRSQTLRLPLTPEEYREFMQTPFKFFLPIDLPPGEITLRLGVFDTIANKAGTLEVPLAIPKK